MRRGLKLLLAFGLLHLGYVWHGTLGSLISAFQPEAALVVIGGPVLVSALWWPGELSRAVRLGWGGGGDEPGPLQRAIQNLRSVRKVVLACGGLGIVMGSGMLVRADYGSREVQDALSLAWSSGLCALLVSEFVLAPLSIRVGLRTLPDLPAHKFKWGDASFRKTLKSGGNGLALGSLVWFVFASAFGAFTGVGFFPSPLSALWIALPVLAALLIGLAWLGSAAFMTALETTRSKKPPTSALQQAVLLFWGVQGLFSAVAAWTFSVGVLVLFSNLSDEVSVALFPSLISLALAPALVFVVGQVWFAARLHQVKRMLRVGGESLDLLKQVSFRAQAVPMALVLTVIVMAVIAEGFMPNVN